jgi:hypothetical protein
MHILQNEKRSGSPYFMFGFVLVLVLTSCRPTKQPRYESIYEPVESTVKITEQTETLVSLPTALPSPTLTPVPTSTPTPTPEPFFLEKFTTDPLYWTAYQLHGENDLYSIIPGENGLRFEINGADLYAYYMYTGQNYENVRIDLEAENLGVNNNNIGIICRASDEGWYEFSAFSSGLYYIFRVTNTEGYQVIASGGIRSMKVGKYTNIFSVICEDNQLTFLVNDQEIRNITDEAFISGQIGINVSSYQYLPVSVEIHSIEISEP